MLIGEYAHSLDAKGRVNFPAKMREHLGEHFILTKGLDGCLFVYAMDEWGRLEEKIKALPMSKARTLQRFLFSGAVDVELDKQGRIVIPPNLRDYAELSKEVMIIGASVRAEIWDKEKWQKSCEELTPEMVEQAMEELGF
ncbi:MraZ protein [Hydrogenoanaerobacterium saccharovorans]|uniref:Transcriptional regulator MraZ n=1 Tax=Hydrogenoanaerobacterium saccharovorans TaxID=474960 RepID=A0A1H8AGG3_9FIRM|nr:division/cell wall cluster transcriptional repressor MraZ [Hydrogenoanaerobacterium saccharovorans]RPF47999.1 MraZ protein [Hydrogenoanaerobacterium saccharovorans]SEM68928.1 MraZ protein [Hydrogenoanaerobacterium saccharovorans]